MLECWELDPAQRPSFKELKKVFENMIEENPDFEYLDLNIAVTADVQEETITSPTKEVA